MSNAVEDRSWAEGMSQEEFNAEFPRHTKITDMIPDVNMYVENIHGQKVYVDTNVNPEDIRPEDDGLHGPRAATINMNEKVAGGLTCEFCGKTEIKSKLGLMAHQRFCKVKKGN